MSSKLHETARATPRQRIYRHPLAVRLWHWVNAGCVIALLLSGFQIFNAHPRLYIGNTGYYDTKAVFEITGPDDISDRSSWVRIGAVKIPTTGVLGVPKVTYNYGPHRYAFPPWLRLPSTDDLGAGRGWHFLMLWIFFLNAVVYVVFLILSRRFWNVLTPTRRQLRPSEIIRDIRRHLCMVHERGAAALEYNFLQKLSYLIVIFMLIPLMVATGMTMSNSAVANFPWLIDVFFGRQTARTLHFAGAILLLLFLVIHIFQVFAAGFRREMRAILTGYYEIPEGDAR